MSTYKNKILAICGSSRNNSTNEIILKAIASLYADQLDFLIYKQLSELPHFNPDLDIEAVPFAVKEFRKRIEDADGVLICTPEYVFSLPGSLKNALEWTVSTTLFSEKPVAFIVASALGEKTFDSLLLIMKTLQATIHEKSALLIQGAKSKVENRDQISDEKTLLQITKLMDSFTASIKEASP